LVLTFAYFLKISPNSVELVGEGLRGGKVVRLFYGKRTGARSAAFSATLILHNWYPEFAPNLNPENGDTTKMVGGPVSASCVAPKLE